MLGEELRRARDEAGLSQEEVAARANVDRSYLSQLENDHKSPTLDLLMRVCDAIGIKIGNVAALHAVPDGHQNSFSRSSPSEPADSDAPCGTATVVCASSMRAGPTTVPAGAPQYTSVLVHPGPGQ